MIDDAELVARSEHGWGGRFTVVRPLIGGTMSAVTLVERDSQFLVAKEVALTNASAQWQGELLAALARHGMSVPRQLPTQSGGFIHDGIVLSTYIDGRLPGPQANRFPIRDY